MNLDQVLSIVEKHSQNGARYKTDSRKYTNWSTLHNARGIVVSLKAKLMIK